MAKQIPEHYKLIYNRLQIGDAVKTIAKQVSPWLNEAREQTGQDVVAIPVMRGGMFFFCDLARQLDYSVDLRLARTWGYDIGSHSASKEIRIDLSDVDAKDRSILLIDDICDSGRTLKALQQNLLKAGARAVRSAVLIRRLIEPLTYEPEYCGFEFLGSDWFVGYGMEDNERWRNLPEIYTIENPDSKPNGSANTKSKT
jgi:hypoxanthine phosphoribosyltransferase